MIYVLFGCAKKVVLVALLFCLLNAGVLNAMEEELLDQQLASSSTAQQKAVSKIDCDSCFSSLSFPESWRPSKWSFSFPESWCYSKWSFKNRKQKISVKPAEVASESNKSQSLGGPIGSLVVDAGRMGGGRVEDYEEDTSITDEELTDATINRQNSAARIGSGAAILYRTLLPGIESSSDASVDTLVERNIIRMLFVEDDADIRESVESVLIAYNSDLSKKYKIEYEFLTHGIFAVEYLLLPENIKPHIIVTDNNMESFYSEISSEVQWQSKAYKTCIDKKAGCELGKFLRPERTELGEGPSIYNFECISKTITKQFYTLQKKDGVHVYERINCDCVYSDEFLTFDAGSFKGLVFLSTSDSSKELGPKNIALFDGLPPKLRYVQTFNKFLKDNEDEIDEVLRRY